MRQRAWTDAFLCAMGLLFGGFLGFALWRVPAKWTPGRLIAIAGGVSIAGSGIYRGPRAWRRIRLWRDGRATVARLTEEHDVEFDVDGEPFVVPQDALLDGPLRSRSTIVYDPREPRRPLVISIGMLTPEVVRSALTTDRAVLPPTPRAPNPRWNRRGGVGIGQVFALAGLLLGAALVLAVATQDMIPELRWGCFGFAALLIFAGALVVLHMIRTAARRRALWRHGLEARAEVRLENAVGYWMRVEIGDVRWEGARKIAPEARALIDPDGDRPVILIDPHDPEGLDVVLVTEVPARL